VEIKVALDDLGVYVNEANPVLHFPSPIKIFENVKRSVFSGDCVTQYVTPKQVRLSDDAVNY
jgi:flavorubredoxin